MTSNHINFKVGGGNHPHDPDAVLGDAPTPTGETLADFEGSTYTSPIGDWTTTGDAFGTGPAQGTLPNQQQVTGYLGNGLVNTFLNGDASTGTLTSPAFTVDKKYLDFLIGGGAHPASSDAPTAVELIVDGKVVRSATGSNGEALNWASWDLSDLQGKQARIKVVDDNTGGWGHIDLDQVVLSDTQAKPPPPRPASTCSSTARSSRASPAPTPRTSTGPPSTPPPTKARRSSSRSPTPTPAAGDTSSPTSSPPPTSPP